MFTSNGGLIKIRWMHRVQVVSRLFSEKALSKMRRFKWAKLPQKLVDILNFTVPPIPPADWAGEVGGEVGGVLPGGVPAPAAEHAAHTEPPGADPLGHTLLVCNMASSHHLLSRFYCSLYNSLHLSTLSLSSRSHSAPCWHCRGCW